MVELTAIAEQNLPAKQKILVFVFNYFKLIKEMVDRNGTLRSGFFRNSWGLEHFRKSFDLKEKQLLQQIITEGKESGEFDVESVRRTAEIFHNCMRGFEAPYIRGKLWQGNTREEIRFEARRLIFGALGFILSLGMAVLLLVPLPGLNVSLGHESYMLLIAWIIVGVIFYRIRRHKGGDKASYDYAKHKF